MIVPAPMNLPYYHVDAFTDRAFHGNPAGVCLLADWLPDELLQSIATENNLSETAFLVRHASSYGLRWFAPAHEVDLCGHATLATAHVLFEHLGALDSVLRFQTLSGELTVTRGEDGLLALDFPSRPASACEPPEALIAGLGARPHFTARARDYLAVFENEEQVRAIQPDSPTLSQLDCLGIIATAPGRDSDFVSRFFAPRAGVSEDPVTGSSHCTLIPYWALRLDRSRLHARQVSARGGELFCEDLGERVSIGGYAVTHATGFIQVTR